MVNEAARCVEENVVDSPEDADYGMILGTGFAPFRGGPLRFAEHFGIKKVVDELERLAQSEEKFLPCEILKKHARDGTTFYEGMKSPLEAPEKQIAEETSAKPEKPAAAVIDTSKMAKGQREALELAEAARDPLEDRGSFASNLFVGRYDFDRIYPYPAQSAEDRAAGEEFLQKLESYLREQCRPG